MKNNEEVYLDGAANTPVDPRVFKAMKPFLTKRYGNSHAIHSWGTKMMTQIEESRQEINSIIGSENHQVYFTSGATEGNNWVIKSLADHERIYNHMKRDTIICSAIEHSSVLNACKALEADGFKVIYIKPHPNGEINLFDVVNKLSEQVLLCCIMSANNETGASNLIDRMAYFCHLKGILFLGDCTQALTYGKEYVELANRYPNVDYMTFSGHKIYGPTGIGVLLVRKEAPVYPLLWGGAQENGKRGGTHNNVGIIGLAKALELLHQESHEQHYIELDSFLLKEIGKINQKYNINITVNGDSKSRYKNIINLNLYSIHPFFQVASTLNTYGAAVSAGSACDSDMKEDEDPKPSHVLVAMGVPINEIGSCVRLSFTKYTTIHDIKIFLKHIEKIVQLYKTVQ